MRPVLWRYLNTINCFLNCLSSRGFKVRLQPTLDFVRQFACNHSSVKGSVIPQTLDRRVLPWGKVGMRNQDTICPYSTILTTPIFEIRLWNVVVVVVEFFSGCCS